MDIIAQIARTLNLKREQINEVLNLFAEDATVPFISRYRKRENWRIG